MIEDHTTVTDKPGIPDPNVGVLYSIHGKGYWPQFVVAVHSLRQHYRGPVCIMALDNDGYEIARRIADTPGMQPIEILCPHVAVGPRNSGYAAKPQLPALSPFRRGVFLDADTVVVDGSFFADLLPCGGEEVVLTRFADWHTQGKLIGGRCRKWEHAAPAEVAQALAHSWPAVNTGVFGYRRESQFFAHDWPAMTARNISFICDEIAAQLLVPQYYRTAGCRMQIMDDSYNCSPIYGTVAGQCNPKIWHFHGGKHLRPGRARNIWWAAYMDACRANIAGIRDWAATINQALELGTAV